MASKIGVVLFLAVIMLGVILGSLAIATWNAKSIIATISSSKLTAAKVTSCNSRRSRKPKSSYSWAPIATTDNGEKAEGQLAWSSKSWCLSNIGDEVTIFVSKKKNGKNKLNTFFQFSFLPLVYLISCMVFSFYVPYILYRDRKMLKQNLRKNYLVYNYRFPAVNCS